MTVTLNNINIDESQLGDFCRKYHITRLAFFGSVLRDDFRPDSDVDVLVDFDPKHIPGMMFFGEMPDNLSNIIGRRVDLRTPQCLSKYIRERVVKESQVLYGN